MKEKKIEEKLFLSIRCLHTLQGTLLSRFTIETENFKTFTEKITKNKYHAEECNYCKQTECTEYENKCQFFIIWQIRFTHFGLEKNSWKQLIVLNSIIELK